MRRTTGAGDGGAVESGTGVPMEATPGATAVTGPVASGDAVDAGEAVDAGVPDGPAGAGDVN